MATPLLSSLTPRPSNTKLFAHRCFQVYWRPSTATRNSHYLSRSLKYPMLPSRTRLVNAAHATNVTSALLTCLKHPASKSSTVYSTAWWICLAHPWLPRTAANWDIGSKSLVTQHSSLAALLTFTYGTRTAMSEKKYASARSACFTLQSLTTLNWLTPLLPLSLTSNPSCNNIVIKTSMTDTWQSTRESTHFSVVL